MSESIDSSRVILFTDQFGLVYARVQAAKNISSKLRHGTQDYTYGQFSLIKGKSGWKAVSVIPEKNYFELLKSSNQKTAVMVSVLNLLKKLSPEEDSASPLFEIIKNFLEFIVHSKEGDVMLAECLVLLRILHTLGYMRHDPELSLPISRSEISAADIELVAPRRTKIIALINESLRATHI